MCVIVGLLLGVCFVHVCLYACVRVYVRAFVYVCVVSVGLVSYVRAYVPSAEWVPGERAVRGGMVSHDRGVLLGVPQAWCHLAAEAAALHHEPKQVQVTNKCCW